MMMRSSATVNTAQEEYKYFVSTRPLCTQNSPSTLLRFRDKMICRENRNNIDTRQSSQCPTNALNIYDAVSIKLRTT
jgi:hypothetical protein